MKIVLWILFGIGLVWLLLNFSVQWHNEPYNEEFGEKSSRNSVLVIYHPDAIKDLDHQLAVAAAKEMVSNGYFAAVATVPFVTKVDAGRFQKLIIIANTYNWSPDWAVSDWVKNSSILKGKEVFAITLGSGSTKTAQRELENLLQVKEVILKRSIPLWLLRPNVEGRESQSNVELAKEVLVQELNKHFIDIHSGS